MPLPISSRTRGWTTEDHYRHAVIRGLYRVNESVFSGRARERHGRVPSRKTGVCSASACTLHGDEHRIAWTVVTNCGSDYAPTWDLFLTLIPISSSSNISSNKSVTCCETKIEKILWIWCCRTWRHSAAAELHKTMVLALLLLLHILL